MIAIDVAEQRSIHRERRGDQLKREEIEADEQLEAAKAVAGPEPRAVTDGGEPEETGDLETLHIGDHVQDREDPEATMVVVGLDTLQADAYTVGKELTVADVNPEYPETDDVVEVVFPNKTDMDIDTKRYAYPRGRLEAVARVHSERGDDE